MRGGACAPWCYSPGRAERCCDRLPRPAVAGESPVNHISRLLGRLSPKRQPLSKEQSPFLEEIGKHIDRTGSLDQVWAENVRRGREAEAQRLSLPGYDRVILKSLAASLSFSWFMGVGVGTGTFLSVDWRFFLPMSLGCFLGVLFSSIATIDLISICKELDRALRAREEREQ